jgi:hypothetical protein
MKTTMELKTLLKMLLAAAKMYWARFVAWLLALLGLCIMFGCSGITPVSADALSVYCTNANECSERAAASCPSHAYRVYSTGPTTMTFECYASGDDSRNSERNSR